LPTRHEVFKVIETSFFDPAFTNAFRGLQRLGV